MSGTSLDGVDAALLRTDGETIAAFGASEYRAYSDDERGRIAQALGQWHDGADVAQAAETVETVHAALLSRMMTTEPDQKPVLIGFHGQTLAHDPDNQRTHQTGDGALLAEILQCPVVWDFRSADVQLGGQGAPLAPFFHFACAKYLSLDAPTVFLNLGGVGNVTYVDPSHNKPQTEGALLAFDTGPANAPINDLMQSRLNKSYDRDGGLAAQGTADAQVVEKFLNQAYFHKMPPKSLDRDDFAQLSHHVADLADADAAATLSECCAAAVARAMEHMPKKPTRILVCGGGRRNAHIMGSLQALTGLQIDDIDDHGLDGDMLEAQAFAYLAVRVARGLPTSCPSTTGVGANVGGGTVSHP
ncbi:anhydro-N-acetylmuramic acid kinase [Litoreibacter halocynthiae]|uniref:anhydro-N-acetylmuramic acid kinase n=1 Tax=Litoreibacter halocynthiae TaxID=1242689 RepID=UPI003D7D187B